MTFEEFLQIQIHDANNLKNIGLFINRRYLYFRNTQSLHNQN